ncbi:MAG: zinc ribbon domain-containing protein [candidate division WOR-3 bacterium]
MPFKDFIERLSDVKVQKGDIPVWWLYTVGNGGEIFYNGLKEGKIKGSYCENCESIILPPRVYCEDCFERIEKFVDVEGPFVVLAMTQSYLDLDGNPLDKPQKIALIGVPDAKGGIIHFLDPDTEIDTGDIVEPIFNEDRVGSLKDIKYFTIKK